MFLIVVYKNGQSQGYEIEEFNFRHGRLSVQKKGGGFEFFDGPEIASLKIVKV